MALGLPDALFAAFLTAKKKSSLASGCLLMTAADSEAELKKNFICWLIIYKPQPNLHLGETSIQGTLNLVPRVSPELSPELRFHCKTFSSDFNDVI